MSTIDTTQIYVSGLPPIEFTFNSDGQAFTSDGTSVNGITFGFNPLPPCDPCTFVATPVRVPEVPSTPSIPLWVVIVPSRGGAVPEVPRGVDTPEVGVGWLMVTGLILILLSKKLLW